jgi:uncharacterized membrane protein
MTAPSAPTSQRFNVLSIVGFIFAFIISIVGVVLGFIALSQIRRTGERGRGLAIAAVIIGLASIVISIISFVVIGTSGLMVNGS